MLGVNPNSLVMPGYTMSLRPEPLPAIPDDRGGSACRLSQGTLCRPTRGVRHTLCRSALYRSLSSCGPPRGPPWRLALVMVMQYMEGLTDRQAADAVRRHGLKYA